MAEPWSIYAQEDTHTDQFWCQNVLTDLEI